MRLAILLLYICSAAAPGGPPQATRSTDPGPRQNQTGSNARVQAAVAGSPLALPFKKTWERLTQTAAALPPSLDDGRIYLPLTAGRAVCLDRATGALLWTSEPGGSIAAPIAVGEDSIYVVTNKNGEDGAAAEASLRALDKVTGLTIWSRDYPRPLTSHLAIGVGRIYAGAADGALYALDAANGEVIWKLGTRDVVRGRALVAGRAVYFGSDDGALRGVDVDSGREVWTFQTGGPVVALPAIDGPDIIFGSADSYVYCVAMETRKLKWKSRTGAAVVAAPVVAGDRILVASYDNFVYALARRSGDRLWKRRLDNRLVADPIVEGDAALIAPLRSNHVAVFMTSDGREVNLYRLDDGHEIVAAPVFSDGTLLLATDKGLIVATTGAQDVAPRNSADKR